MLGSSNLGKPVSSNKSPMSERGAVFIGAALGGILVVGVFTVAAIALGLLFSACSMQLRPLPKPEVSAEAVKAKDPRVVFRFFDDDFTPGGYQYTYPDASKIYIPEESGHESDVALEFNLKADDYSGGSVCLYNLLYDATPYYSRGALQFWVKGSTGGEIAWAALVDDENRDSKKTVVRLPLNNYGGITKEWRLVSIPLADFGRRGVYWDPKKRIEVPNAFDWSLLAEFRIEIKIAENPDFKVWVDDIFVLRDVFEPKQEVQTEGWDERQDTLPAHPPLPDSLKAKVVNTLIENDMPAGGFPYVYGGKTALKIQPVNAQGAPSSESGNTGALAVYLDNDDYSGATVAMGAGHNIDLSGLRNGTAGLTFWAKGGPGTKAIYLGLLDDESDGKKVQTKLSISDFGVIDTSWRYFQIPLKRFLPIGRFWDGKKKAELTDNVDWKAINELRFSNNKGENKPDAGQPVAFYTDEIRIIEAIPGYVDPDAFWAAFKSSEPDLTLHDFESAADQKWEVAKGEKSEIAAVVIAPKGDAQGKGKHALNVTYRLADWCDAMYDYKKNSTPAKNRDWTKHWGLRFSFYTDKAFQGITVQVNDAGNEIFVTNVGGVKGWNDILVPFKSFAKFPYYQPPDAEQNGTFDIKGIAKVDFKPAGDGTRGSYMIDNVQLTNLRELPKVVVASHRNAVVRGDVGKIITASINPGIFGINSALWDGDLLDTRTETLVKAVNHGVLRYPGGLRADEDHWEQVLNKKDHMVDIDEFLDFCKKTNTEPMITVNFGTGTPEEAAAWVKHVNVVKKAKVRYWEVGNELYGNWHPQFTTGDVYGKKTADFIKAMKAVDPTIEVSVVWVMDGEWNKQVLEATKEIADAVIVHHYPQHSGEENDAALLSAPQSLDEILPSVKNQIKEFGKPGKKYGIWLTEWNSVDFKPGPQTLSLVNGLFVADYLGMLAKHNIEHADYWDIHNDITDQGGDYGYLSRNGAPDGDIVPRPSYHAFAMASKALRGQLLDCSSNDDNVTCYMAKKPDGKVSLLFINKSPKTEVTASLQIKGLKAGDSWTLDRLDETNSKSGPVSEAFTGTNIALKSYSITLLQQK